MLQKIERQELYEEVATHIEKLILSGQLKVGDPLPSGRKMAKELGVGSTVVMQALRMLADRGLVRIERGTGAFVAAAVEVTLADCLRRLIWMKNDSLRNLAETRRLLEVEIAGLAAQRATPQDIKALTTAWERFAASVAFPNDFIESDIDFHTVLARATGNDILLLLVDSFRQALRDSIWQQMALFRKKHMNKNIQMHRRILEAVASGDSEKARQAMQEHMRVVEKVVARAKPPQTKGTKATPPPLSAMRGDNAGELELALRR